MISEAAVTYEFSNQSRSGQVAMEHEEHQSPAMPGCMFMHSKTFPYGV